MLDFTNVTIADYSGAQSLIDVIVKYKDKGITLELINIDEDSLAHIKRIDNKID